METKTDTIEWAKLKYQVGEILVRKFLEYNDGKFHLPVELNPAVHEVTEFIAERLKQERNKVIDEFYNLMDKELQTEPINRARYMNRLFEFKEFLKDKSHE